MEAVRIEKRNVPKNEFAVSKSKRIIASFQALDTNVQMDQPNKQQIQCYQEKMKAAMDEVKDFEKTICYVSFIVNKDGTASNIGILSKDSYGFYKTAMNILATCTFTFNPGTIEGKPVESLSYMPVTFEK